MDESDHLTLVNAGDEEVVSQEEGGREGSAAGGEEGGSRCGGGLLQTDPQERALAKTSTASSGLLLFITVGPMKKL